MAEKTIPQLPSASSINDNTLFPIDTGAQTFKATALQIKNYNNQEIYSDLNNVLLPLAENLLTKNFKENSTYDYLKQIIYNPNERQIVGIRSNIVGSTNRVIAKTTALSNETEFSPSAASNVNAKNWQAGCYSSSLNLYVLVGVYDTNQNSIATNEGNINLPWTLRSANTNESLRGVEWSESLGIFVATGDNGTILTSSNGIAWTAQSSGTTDNLGCVEWSESLGIFVAVNMQSTTKILTSPDGETWTAQSIVLSSQGDHKVKYLKDRFFVVGAFLDGFLTSPDGETWTAQSINIPGSPSIVDITYCEKLDIFFAAQVNNDGPVISKSKDLIVWSHDFISNEGLPYCIEYIEGAGLIVGGDENTNTFQSLTI